MNLGVPKRDTLLVVRRGRAMDWKAVEWPDRDNRCDTIHLPDASADTEAMLPRREW